MVELWAAMKAVVTAATLADSSVVSKAAAWADQLADQWVALMGMTMVERWAFVLAVEMAVETVETSDDLSAELSVETSVESTDMTSAVDWVDYLVDSMAASTVDWKVIVWVVDLADERVAQMDVDWVGSMAASWDTTMVVDWVEQSDDCLVVATVVNWVVPWAVATVVDWDDLMVVW